MTKYARDEFDKVPESASRQGVHRAASAPARRKLWPILAVGIVALAIGVFSFLILPKLGSTQAGSEASTSLESTAAPEASSAPSVTAESSADPEPSKSPDAEPSASPSNVPSAAVLDKTQGVAIYNAAGTAGLAGRVSSMVQTDGWTLGQVGNWGGAPQQTSAIFYAGPAQEANAEALSKLLNIPTLVDTQEFQVPLVVVLGPGYQ
ncbi:LytR C-terminal domain-containing protein [Pseudarthrobacter sp. AL07]|uniref:LytR C-terminal domain-containing protein n=1 Tax=unclassified Pseudarthrobacter TaxID=2647000 RepID=UPI00249A2760|nr:MULTISPECIES: LytR C-terminal domain-containing protein [unclassified Pseudarthrobacter]MDI3195291.1 LytR C-terminal domain-containing protein [Pseudarthrobacter sp. AL20]MDI3209397.1 LytR C-terminal domain-containing protein [Pseudarthrobacter sp. AL07]